MIALAVGLVASTLLLGGGWLAATWRERASVMERERERLTRAAAVVQGAVDESLGELREREAERAFSVYSHFYSPPDVLAITDPVAVSPLAGEPRDPRVEGYFQVDPDGVVRTPHDTPGAPPSELGLRVSARVSGPGLATVRARARSPETPPPRTTPDALLRLTFGGADGSGSAPGSAPGSVSTVAQNSWGNLQAQDIYAAQAGDEEAGARVLARGRQAPIENRRNVGWDAPQASSSARLQVQASGRPTRGAVRAALERYGDAVRGCAPEREVEVRVRLAASDGRPLGISVEGAETLEARACVTQALRTLALGPIGTSLVVDYRFGAGVVPTISDAPAADNRLQTETEVAYTPMTFLRTGDTWILHRVVTRGETSVVQGLLLDRAAVEAWITDLVTRRDAGPARLIEAGEGRCSVRRPASEVLQGLELCFAEGALRGASLRHDAELRWQIAALAALLMVALLAAALIVRAARRAEALSRQKSAFVSAVSHELRTPLTTLRMHAEMLAEGMVSEERRPRVHRELVTESVRLARLVDNVLSLAKLEEGQRRLALEDGDLRAHVRQVVEGLRARVEARGFTLEGPEDGERVDASFDPQAIEQVVTNLIENAVKYGRGAEDAIEVWVGRRDGRPTLIVRDRGPGVPAKERARVLERFHRVERADTAHTPGTGIGLSLVADLLEAHGGQVEVRERAGGGCEVVAQLS